MLLMKKKQTTEKIKNEPHGLGGGVVSVEPLGANKNIMEKQNE